MTSNSTKFLTSCPRCGYITKAQTDNGVVARVKCKMCGYQGNLPIPDLKDRPWRVF
jgi:predicted RNA-binding Zn-ribbon protein involved in translation (DUF1610 family)